MCEIDAKRDLIMERKVMGKPVIPDMNRDADENMFYRLKVIELEVMRIHPFECSSGPFLTTWNFRHGHGDNRPTRFYTYFFFFLNNPTRLNMKKTLILPQIKRATHRLGPGLLSNLLYR